MLLDRIFDHSDVAIIDNAVDTMRRFGVRKPKVALLAHNELVSEKVPASTDACKLAELNRQGKIKDCTVEGPLSLDLALSRRACRHKGFRTRVGGEADILVCPDILTGNVLYKSMTLLGKAKGAALIAGAAVPVVVTSRADSAETKLLSIALAVKLGGNKRP